MSEVNGLFKLNIPFPVRSRVIKKPVSSQTDKLMAGTKIYQFERTGTNLNHPSEITEVEPSQ